MKATAVHEAPVFLGAPGEELFGVLTDPEGGGSGVAALVLWSGSEHPVAGKNQVRRRLARRLAAEGLHVLAVNYRGVGESAGARRVVDLDKPFTDDVVTAMAWLDDQGFDRVVVIGLCFGGRSALVAAPQLPNLAALALVASPMGQASHFEALAEAPMSSYLSRARSLSSLRLLVGRDKAARARRRLVRRKLTGVARRLVGREAPRRSDATPEQVRPLAALLDAGVPVLFLYGNGDDFLPSFERTRDGALAPVLDRAGSLATVRVVEGRMADLESVGSQVAFLDVLGEWAASVAAAPTTR